MFRFEPGLKVYLHREPVDGRKAINGLALLVEQALGLNPFEPAIYVFSNRRRDRIKLLVWDRTAFWLMLKRLEADRFCWPKDAAVVTLTVEQLHWLLAGIDLAAMQALLSEQQRLANQVRFVTVERDLLKERVDAFLHRLYAAKSEARTNPCAARSIPE